MIHRLPNALTVLRIVLTPIFVVMLLMHPHDFTWRIWSAVVFGIAILTDLFDGKIARKYNVVSDFGKIWDPIADKALTGAGFICLSVIGELWWWVTIVVLVREVGITILREWLKKKKVIMPANKGGKLKTLTQSFALILFIMWLEKLPVVLAWTAYVLMAVAVALTVYSGVVYLFEARKRLAETETETG